MAAARLKAAQMAKAGPDMSWSRFVQYLKDIQSELKKTTWPDNKTLSKSTMIVLAFIFATAVWNGVIDLTLTHLTANVFGR